MSDPIEHVYAVPQTNGANVTHAEGRDARPSDHAVFGASSASIWMNCPGMYGLLEHARATGAVPAQDTSGVYAREGSAAHEVIEGALLELFQTLQAGMERSVALYSPSVAETHHVTISDPQEFADATKTCIDHVLNVWNQPSGSPRAIGIENTFNLNGLYDLYGDYLTNDPEVLARDHPLFGTGDISMVQGGIGTIIDYKHGAGVPVDAKDNPQLKYYALGMLLAEEAKGRKLRTVEAHIVQPRAAHADGQAIRATLFSRDELFEFGLEVVLAVDKAVGKPETFNPGPWCRFCKAAQAPCPAIVERARAAAKESFGDIDAVPQDKDGAESMARAMSNDELAGELERVEAFQVWIKAVGAAASHRIKTGQTIPGYKAVRGRSPRKWTNEAAVADALEQWGAGSKAVFTKPLSVAQLEKAAKRDSDLRTAFDELLVEGFATKAEGAITYAPEDDPRPAVNPAAESFGELDEDDY